MYTTLISAPELQSLIASGRPVALFDCSFDLADPAAADRLFAETHLPSAQQAHLDRDLSAHAGDARESGGRHPLPTRAAFAQWIGAHGVGPDTQVVVYERSGANFCGRLWWMLKWLGHEAVAVLDGGLAAWQAAGGAIERGPAARPVPRRFEAGEARARLVRAEAVARDLSRPTQTLIDARAPARFRGEVEPLDPVAGHIPGALNRPFTANFTPDGRFKPAEQLRAEWTALLGQRSAPTVVHHCGSGVSAIPNLLAMEIAGFPRTALFAGSWSEWCNTPGLPVARG
jgi:thiosulfate/3-mercaptopyruvate sulfurtransferase